jgi:acetolactate decarboxylase
MVTKLYALAALFIATLPSLAQSQRNEVKFTGSMKNVMWNGKLEGVIDLATIINKQHLYGVGPVEFLRGEIIIIDGKSYRSSVEGTGMKVEETFEIKAPFFVYANVDRWREQTLPEGIQTIQALETYLEQNSGLAIRPFAIKLTGIVSAATIHVVNLPEGSIVRSPEDAHKGEVKYHLKNEPAEVIGFFSTEHKGVFTHHDTFLHLHLITSDRSKMGHLDDVAFKKGSLKLYLPME